MLEFEIGVENDLLVLGKNEGFLPNINSISKGDNCKASPWFLNGTPLVPHWDIAILKPGMPCD